MAEYNLSQLNTTTEVMPPDLLHIRVKKRGTMLGDEDRAILYTDFLAGFQLNRFLEKSGGTMTGELEVTKITSNGADAVDGTSAQMYFGSSIRQTVIKSSALNNVQISNGTTAGAIYHTANKPSPNELGMRTNAENDSRFAIKGTPNTFTGTQTILSSKPLTLKSNAGGSTNYIEGLLNDNSVQWEVGSFSDGSVTLSNKKTGTVLSLSTAALINRTLLIAGQVQPSDFSNLDARFFTQTVANSRFAQLAGNNNFTGDITFTKGSGRAPIFLGTGQSLTLKSSSTTDKTLYIDAVDSAGTRKWHIGNGGDSESFIISLLNNVNSLAMDSGSSSFSKPVNITGQVIPTDFSNFDSRYIPVGTLSNLARRNAQNTFTHKQTIDTTSADALIINSPSGKRGYISGYVGGTRKWLFGTTVDASDVLRVTNEALGATLTIDSTFKLNKNVEVTGQIQPSDWANIDSRYIAKSVESDLAKLGNNNIFTGGNNTFKGGSDVLRVKSSSSKKAIFIRAYDSDDSVRWYIGNGTDGDDTLNLTNYKGGSSLRLGDNSIASTKTFSITGQVQPSDWGNIDSRYLPSGVKLERPLLFRAFNTETNGDIRSALTLSGFIRKPSNYKPSDIIKGLTIHVANPKFANGEWSRGITFEHSDTANPYRLYTYGYTTSLDEPLTPKRIYTEADKPTPAELGTYTSAQIDQSIAQSAANSTDLKKVYPVGIVVWFNSNVNPNTALVDAGMTWTYLSGAVGRSIRVGAANGSDVTQTGGSDNVTLAAGNIPSHTHSFSATTDSYDYGTKTSNSTGAHTHTRGTMDITGYVASPATAIAGSVDLGYSDGAFTTKKPSPIRISKTTGAGWGGEPYIYQADFQASRTWTGSTSSTGAHTHTVAIGSHTHSVSGTTGATGSGQSFSVQNQFYRLMAWVRTA